ncbi:MAG: TlpA family protein disulfide reductase [Salinivirgaceae bacterium]|nr:TlpA family protein disulfide reductase [Salinivirgaceae bacterium]
MFKNYLKKKSKIGLAVDAAIVILFILLLIPATRKEVAALILKPTLFIHQPKVNNNKPIISDNAYDWKLQNLAGEKIKLSTFENNVLIINLWATWCPPCIAEMPDLQRLYNDYGDKVSFLFVSNESDATIKEFIDKKGYTFPVYTPLTQYPNDFETNTIPTTYIISKKGELVINKTGVAQWNSKRIRQILDVLINQ